MLNVKGAKTDMVVNQTQAFLKSLAKTLDVNQEDLEVKLSAELEFYIVDKNNQPLSQRLSNESREIIDLKRVLKIYDKQFQDNEGNERNVDWNGTKQIRIESLEEEDGYNQFEVQFIPTNNPVELAENIVNFKTLIGQIVDVDFRAKPYETEPTSSLHFHISVYYKGNNLFAKDNPRDDDEYHYLPLYWCIAGMLALMPKFMKYFAPTENCRERYVMPKRGQKYIHYPTRICWGFNNRTCAIRIPRKPSEDPLNCRIEHRVSSSMADPYLVLFAIFAGMQYGVAQTLDAPEPIYTRAFEDDEAGKLIIACFDDIV